MARHPFSTSPSYLHTIRGLHRLHDLAVLGQNDSSEADAIRDGLEQYWYDLSVVEQERVNGLSEDLYSISDPIRQPLSSNPQVQRNLSQAFEANRLGKWDQALALLRRWGRHIDPALLSFLRGSIWQEAGDSETAVLFFEHASRQAPEFYKSNYIHVLQKTDADAARRIAGDLLDAEEDNTPDVLVTAAGILFDSARNRPIAEANYLFERLIATLKRALDRIRGKEPQLPTWGDELEARAALLLAGCHDAMGDSRVAIRYINMALAVDPADPTVLTIRGILRYGAEPGAVDDFLKARQLGSPNVWPDFFLAYQAFIDGRFEDCLKYCERGLTFLVRDEVRAMLNEWLAISRVELGYPVDQVRSSFEEAIRLAPDSDRIRDNLATFESALANPTDPRPDWMKPKASAIRTFGRPDFRLPQPPRPIAA